MKIATLTSLKGGVAKTAIGVSEATYLSFFGRVLFIDANPQKDASRKFIYKKDENGNMVDISSPENCFENIFFGKPVTPLNVKENLDILIATDDFQNVNKVIEDKRNNSILFYKWLRKQKIKEYYDYIIIDTHNTNDAILENFYIASDLLIAPTGANEDEMAGATDAYKLCDKIKNDPDLLNDSDEPYCKAKFVFVGSRLKNGSNGGATNQTKQFLEATKDNPLFVANIYHRNIFEDATEQNTTIFDIANQSKYSDASYKEYFKRTQEALEAIKKAIDEA